MEKPTLEDIKCKIALERARKLELQRRKLEGSLLTWPEVVGLLQEIKLGVCDRCRPEIEKIIENLTNAKPA